MSFVNILEIIKDCFFDSFIDSLKLLPFLFITYFVMEYLEHKAGDGMMKAVSKAGKGGPVIGGLLGAFPQCGFSAAASNLYAGKIITTGTLLSVFLSTSDEMLPIMISQKVGFGKICTIIGIKIVAGILVGFIVDYILSGKNRTINIHSVCENHHCHCEDGIIKSTIHHTLEIGGYILGISFALNLIISLIGQEALSGFVLNKPFIGEILSGIVGLIPNCAGSVVITQLYLENVISFGPAITGLLAGSGVGILVLFKVNEDKKENLKILASLYGFSVVLGCIIGLFFK